jgi:glycosyltransferase involved in cell wall biosynthesis
MSYRVPNATVVVSRTLQKHYRDRYGVEVTHIPNGVTLEPSPPPLEIHALGLGGRDYFLFMGRISPEKGLDSLIEAYRRVARRAKLVIAGGSSYTDSYVQSLRQVSPEGVIFPGRVGGRLRAELYANATAFILPSTIEGQSIALLEAMSHRACVISSDIPENRELVDDVGFTIGTRDVEGLSRLMVRVLDNPGEAQELGRRARARVEKEYTWDEIARRTEAFYYSVLGMPPPARLEGHGDHAHEAGISCPPGNCAFRHSPDVAASLGGRKYLATTVAMPGSFRNE